MNLSPPLSECVRCTSKSPKIHEKKYVELNCFNLSPDVRLQIREMTTRRFMQVNVNDCTENLQQRQSAVWLQASLIEICVQSKCIEFLLNENIKQPQIFHIVCAWRLNVQFVSSAICNAITNVWFPFRLVPRIREVQVGHEDLGEEASCK